LILLSRFRGNFEILSNDFNGWSLFWVQGVVGSNPAAPTIEITGKFRTFRASGKTAEPQFVL